MTLNVIPHALLSGLPVRMWATDNNLVVTWSAGGSGLDYLFTSSSALVAQDNRLEYDQTYVQHPDVIAHLRARRGETVSWETGPEGRLHACASPMMTALGEICGVIGIAIDHAKAREEERRRRYTQFILSSLLNEIRDPLAILDNDGRIMLAGQAYLTAAGANREEIITRQENDIINIRTIRPSRPGAEDQFEWTGVHGQTFLSNRIACTSDDGTSIQLHVARDATQEKELLRKLAVVNHKNGQLLQAFARPVAVLDGRGVLHEANDSFAEILRVPRSQLSGADLQQWLSPASQESFSQLRQAGGQATQVQHQRIILHDNTGALILAKTTAHKSHDLDGEPAILLIVEEWGDPAEQVKFNEAQRVGDIDATILELLALGKSNSEIAQDLCLSRQGLDYRLKSLRQQLGVTSRGALVARAYSRGLFDASQWPPTLRKNATS